MFASTFNPTGSYSSTESQNVNNHKSGKLQRTTTPLLLSSSLLLLSSSRTATKLAADVVCLSYSPACLQFHQGLLLPRLMLYPLFSEFGESSTNLLLVFQSPPHLLYLVLSTLIPPISFLRFIRTGPLKLDILTLSIICRSKGSLYAPDTFMLYLTSSLLLWW